MAFRRQLLRRLTNVKIKQCYLDVFKYLIDNNIDCSVNKNGAFFNITTMTDDRLHELETILKQHERTKEGRNDRDA